MRERSNGGVSSGTAGILVLRVLLICCLILLVDSWIMIVNHQGRRPSTTTTTSTKRQRLSSLALSSQPRTAALEVATPTLTAVASSGVSTEELAAVRQAIVLVCQDQEVACQWTKDNNNMVSLQNPVVTTNIPGTTGRVMLLKASADLSQDDLFDLTCAISQEMDEMIYSKPPSSLSQPVLIAIFDESDNSPGGDCDSSRISEHLAARIEQEVQQYEMNVPLPRKTTASNVEYVPSIRVEVDGAQVTDPAAGKSFWDTSSLLVFDDLLSDDLRKRLLRVVLGRREDEVDGWDDARDGPDPRRWVRGGLLDIPNDESQKEGEEDGPCWGLRDDAIAELCFEHHDALQEFETMLSDLLPQFTVSRFSEAVMGSSVSSLTANAPVHGDHFDDHIDGDPNLTPPSPWTDVYGRYPNRCPGKPRFMSCLLYLNNDWKPDEWGAPTRFVDVATDAHYSVQAVPGRCVLMDQDITHSVVAPLEAAGNRPRYSLVWKLILHPKEHGQDMTDLAGERQWPEPLLLGSAAMEPTGKQMV